MKKERRVTLWASMVFLLCASVMFSLSSCSKQSGTTETQLRPSPAKMEGQSENWKVTVGPIKKKPKQDPDLNPIVRGMQGAENKYDTLSVQLGVEYVGSSGNVQFPAIALTDNKGQKFECLQGGPVEPDRDITIIDFNDPKVKQTMEIMEWINSSLPGSSKKVSRALKGHEKVSMQCTFQDPIEYTNLKLVFGDVPPIPLKVPGRTEKG